MSNNEDQIPARRYAVIDFFTAAIAWACFYFTRKLLLKVPVGLPENEHLHF